MNEGKLIWAFRSWFPPLPTDEERAGFPTPSDIEQTLATLSGSGYEDAGRVCYVFSPGGNPRSFYSKMARAAGVRVILYESLVPFVLRWIPSYWGLVKIEDPCKLPSIFDQIVGPDAAVVYIFDSSLGSAFVDAVRGWKGSHDHSFGVKRDPGYLMYAADRDHSPTEMADYLSYSRLGPWKSRLPERRDASGDAEIQQ